MFEDACVEGADTTGCLEAINFGLNTALIEIR
jgi:hypothetical protein